MNLKPTLIAAAILLAAGSGQAQTLANWNFNSPVPDASTSTGSTAPAIGTGTASIIGGLTASFGSGDANGGSSDPATGDDSGWQTTGYPEQGAGDRTAGVQFLVSTAGWQGITLTYDLRHSNTSSRYEAVQVTFDGGLTFTDVATFDGNAGDTWFNNRTVDLSAYAAANDNALFGFRVVAAFAPGTSQYAASSTSYAGTGTWRFDDVTVSALAPVPEPASALLLAAGLGVIGLRRRQRG